MQLPEHAERLTILLGESDRRDGRPIYELIVEKAREHGLAGATVMHGVMGFGANSRIHTAKILRLSEDLPVMIEIVDIPAKIDAFLLTLNSLMVAGLATREAVNVVYYQHAAKG